MSELRSRKQANGHKKANGISSNGYTSGHSSKSRDGPEILVSPEDEVMMKKKLALLEDEQQQCKHQQQAEIKSKQTISDTNNNHNSDNEESFSDTFTMTANPKASKIQQEDNPIVFNKHNSTSSGYSARDQMAASLLRLQAQLDASSQRLSDIEAKVDNLTKRQQQNQKATSGQSSYAASGAKKLLTKDNLTNLAYFTWPVLVFFVMRAIERRNAMKQIA